MHQKAHLTSFAQKIAQRTLSCGMRQAKNDIHKVKQMFGQRYFPLTDMNGWSFVWLILLLRCVY